MWKGLPSIGLRVQDPGGRARRGLGEGRPRCARRAARDKCGGRARVVRDRVTIDAFLCPIIPTGLVLTRPGADLMLVEDGAPRIATTDALIIPQKGPGRRGRTTAVGVHRGAGNVERKPAVVRRVYVEHKEGGEPCRENVRGHMNPATI